MKMLNACVRPKTAAARLLVMAGALLALTSACSRNEDTGPRASAAIGEGRIVVTGARPEFRRGLTPVWGGFFETFRWDESSETLHVKGWVPLDVRIESVRFVLRDPHDRLQLVGSPRFSVAERPDVAAAHPEQGDLTHAGFIASLPLTNLPDHENWTETLEMYCLDGDSSLMRLRRVDAHERHSWDRAPDRFEIAITYSAPALSAGDDTQGSLDHFAALGNGTYRLAGWAPFDGKASRSALILQLAPRVAPASIVSCAWVPRPDVRAAVDPQREELERCGFEVILRTAATEDTLRTRGTVRLWSVDSSGQASTIGLSALRK